MPPNDAHKKQVVPLDLDHKGRHYKGLAVPRKLSCHEGVCFELDVTLNNEQLGLIHCTEHGWKMDHVKDQGLVDAIGKQIFLWYE